MKNITELRNQLGNVFQNLESGALDVKVAAEMNNSAGKMINTVKVQLEYAHLREHLKEEKPSIPFMKQ